MRIQPLNNQKTNARRFAEENLPHLAADVLQWRSTAVLPAESPMHQLAGLCGYVSETYQEAERLVGQLALKQAASAAVDAVAVPGAQAQGSDMASQVGPGSEAYLRLLPKLLEMVQVVDSMSDDEYGGWVNALPKDEFFAYIGVSYTAESLNAAVDEAKALKRS